MNIEIIKDYIKDVTDVTETVRNVNDLNMAIKDFEHSAFEIESENRSLKYEIELRDENIKKLKDNLSAKDNIINKLKEERDYIKAQFQKFKGFWHDLMSHFQKKVSRYKDEHYKVVSDDLYKNGIFDDNDYEIANNELRKVVIPDKNKLNKKKNNDTRF